MKILDNETYKVELSGKEIKLIQFCITNAEMHELLSDQGKAISNQTYKDLENIES